MGQRESTTLPQLAINWQRRTSAVDFFVGVSQSVSRPDPPRKRLRGFLQVGISAVLLAVALRQVGWAELTEALAQIKLSWLAAAWGLFLLGVVVRAYRWQVLLRGLGVDRPLAELTLWYFVGGFFNVLLPTGFGGDAVRVVELAQDTQRVGPVLNSVVVDRYLGLLSLLIMGLIAGLLRPDLASPSLVGLLAVLASGGITAAWLLTRPWWRAAASGDSRWARWLRKTKATDVAAGLTSYRRGAVVQAFLVSVVFNLMQIGWNVLIGLGLGLHLPIVFYFVIVPLTSAALLLPAVGGLGVREVSYITLLGGAGVPQGIAMAFSLSIYAITVLTGLVGGAMYLVQGLNRTRRRN